MAQSSQEPYIPYIRQGVVDFVCIITESVGSVAEVELKLDEEGLKCFWIGTVKLISFSQFGLCVGLSWLLKVYGRVIACMRSGNCRG
jgi:hypothetical protein